MDTDILRLVEDYVRRYPGSLTVDIVKAVQARVCRGRKDQITTQAVITHLSSHGEFENSLAGQLGYAWWETIGTAESS